MIAFSVLLFRCSCNLADVPGAKSTNSPPLPLLLSAYIPYSISHLLLFYKKPLKIGLDIIPIHYFYNSSSFSGNTLNFLVSNLTHKTCSLHALLKATGIFQWTITCYIRSRYMILLRNKLIGLCMIHMLRYISYFVCFVHILVFKRITGLKTICNEIVSIFIFIHSLS